MRLIDAESLKELFPDNGEGSWTYNATAKAYIDVQPSIQPDTTTHGSNVVKKGGNDEDRTTDDLISRQTAIDALNMQAEEMSHWSERYQEQRRGVLTAVNIVADCPSTQPDIIRCKDCEWWTKQENSIQGRCALHKMYPSGNWYCGTARRRGEQDG